MKLLVNLLLILGVSSLSISCASNKHTIIKSNKCLGYYITGDDVEWKPIKFFESTRDNKLYIQMPESIKFIPQLQVYDTEFDRPEGIEYTYNPKTKMFRVDGNYDEYVLSRVDKDTTSTDEVDIKCSREVEISTFNDVPQK